MRTEQRKELRGVQAMSLWVRKMVRKSQEVFIFVFLGGAGGIEYP